MPTYQYACTACGHQLEAVQAFTDPTLTECPECAGRLRKLFSSVGIVFKGSGFYRTDSRSGAADGAKKDKETVGATASDKGGNGSGTPSSAKETGGSSATGAGSSGSGSSGSAGSTTAPASAKPAPAAA